MWALCVCETVHFELVLMDYGPGGGWSSRSGLVGQGGGRSGPQPVWPKGPSAVGEARALAVCLPNHSKARGKEAELATFRVAQMGILKDVTEARAAEVQKQVDEATAAKEAAAKAVEEAKKRAAPRDLTHAIVSQPVFLKINDGPLKISELVDVLAQPDKEVSVPVFFERLYGFAENVEFQLVPGKESKLFEAGRASAAKGANEVSLKATISSEVKPGRYQATVEAKLKFNGQDLTIKRPVAIVLP